MCFSILLRRRTIRLYNGYSLIHDIMKKARMEGFSFEFSKEFKHVPTSEEHCFFASLPVGHCFAHTRTKYISRELLQYKF